MKAQAHLILPRQLPLDIPAITVDDGNVAQILARMAAVEGISEVTFTGYLEGHLPSVQTYYYITISQYRLYGIREQQFNGRAFVANSPKRVWSVQAADTPFEAYDVLMGHILEARGDQDGARP